MLPEGVFLEMAKASAEVAFDNSGAFRVNPLGGLWTAATFGTAQDAWAGTTVGKDSAAWCRRHQLQTSARFYLSLYGAEGSLVCARYWVARLQHFLDMWVDSGAPPKFRYTHAHLDSFQEPKEFSSLTEQCKKPKAQLRFAALRAFALV